MDRFANTRPLNREIGVVATFGRSDSRGKLIGYIVADTDRQRLYFKSSQAPIDIKQGALVTFERGVFKSSDGDFDKAITIRHLTADLNEPGVREQCAGSQNHILWSQVAADHLDALGSALQIAWLKERAGSLSLMPVAAWNALKPETLGDQEIWDAAPANLRATPLENARIALDKEFLSADKMFREKPGQFPPREVFRRLKINCVIKWAK